MQDSLKAMKAALRVLSAVNDTHSPADADIAELESYAGPWPSHETLDEFACDVIQKALQQRAAVRRTFSSSAGG